MKEDTPPQDTKEYSKETLNIRLMGSHCEPLAYQEFRLFGVIHSVRYPVDRIFITDEKGECSLNTKEVFQDKTQSFELKLNKSPYHKDKSIFNCRHILRSYEYGDWCRLKFEEEERLLVTRVEAYSLDLNKEHEFKTKNVKLELRAYYNQEDDINHPLKMRNFTHESLTQEIQENNDTHNKQENTEDKFKERKAQTKWGYIEFDKDVNTDEKLKELSHNFTTPIQELKEFIPLTDDEGKELLGENVHLTYKQDWENKQVRIFAYLERAKSDVSVEVEVSEINYTILYDESKEESSFFSNITWQDVAIEVLSLIPLVRGVRVALSVGKWGLSLLRRGDFTPKKAKEYIKKRIFKKDKKRKTTPIKEVKLSSLPEEARNAYLNYKNHKWQGMYPGQGQGIKNKNEVRAGATFNNDPPKLPQKPERTYKEFDITNRFDSRRFVRDTRSGEVYYTTDHYETFVKIIE